MSEELQTRTEHSRSLEDAEKFRALDTLKEVGLLIPVADLDTFHGRVSTPDEVADWEVDPSFQNGSNDSGNFNVNSRPTLYTSDNKTAQDFADERAGFPQLYHSSLLKKVREYTPEENVGRLERQNAFMKKLWEEEVANGNKTAADSSPTVWTIEQLLQSSSHVEAMHLREALGEQAYRDFKQQYADQRRAEVHEIVTADTDATVLDFSFDDTKLDDEDRAKYQQALKVLALPVTEGSPVSFSDRDKVQPFVSAVQQAKGGGYLLSSDIPELAAAAHVDERVALQLASALNSRHIAIVRPSYLVHELIKRPADIFAASLEIDGEKQDIPINLEYVQRFLREAHIVGVKQSISSATLNRSITAVSFFDLEKTMTEKGLESERKGTWQRLGGMAAALSRYNKGEAQSEQPLVHLLSDAYAKPDTLVAAAKDVEGYDAIFNGDAGNWEGYSLAEHTETVLRNFDESFADNLPVEMLAPIRLAILSHDIGKPIAAAKGEKHKQMEYTITQASDFLSKLGVEDKLKGLLIAIISEGEDLAFQVEVKGAGEPARAAMKDFATNTLRNFYDSESVTNEQITGFTEMCKMLQVCDGGAYTSMAITRPTVKGRGRYRNAPSFNRSFAQPVGFGKRTIRLREEGDKAAEADLTPKGSAEVSRLKINHAGAGRKAPKLSS